MSQAGAYKAGEGKTTALNLENIVGKPVQTRDPLTLRLVARRLSDFRPHPCPGLDAPETCPCLSVGATTRGGTSLPSGLHLGKEQEQQRAQTNERTQTKRPSVRQGAVNLSSVLGFLGEDEDVQSSVMASTPYRIFSADRMWLRSDAESDVTWRHRSQWEGTRWCVEPAICPRSSWSWFFSRTKQGMKSGVKKMHARADESSVFSYGDAVIIVDCRTGRFMDYRGRLTSQKRKAGVFSASTLRFEDLITLGPSATTAVSSEGKETMLFAGRQGGDEAGVSSVDVQISNISLPVWSELPESIQFFITSSYVGPLTARLVCKNWRARSCMLIRAVKASNNFGSLSDHTISRLAAVVGQCCRIRALKLRNFAALTDEQMRIALERSHAALGELDLCGCPALTDMVCISIVDSCPNLKLIKLACTRVTDQGVAHLLDPRHGLKHVCHMNFYGCSNITANGLRQALEKHAGGVQTINIRGCSFDEQEMRALVSFCNGQVITLLTGPASREPAFLS